MVNDILVWVINTHRGTISQYSKRRLDILSLMTIPTNKRCILVNNMERLINNICSVHLALPGAIRHLYVLTSNLAAKNTTANLYAQFH